MFLLLYLSNYIICIKYLSLILAYLLEEKAYILFFDFNRLWEIVDAQYILSTSLFIVEVIA